MSTSAALYVCTQVLILEPNKVFMPSYVQINEEEDEEVGDNTAASL